MIEAIWHVILFVVAIVGTFLCGFIIFSPESNVGFILTVLGSFSLLFFYCWFVLLNGEKRGLLATEKLSKNLIDGEKLIYVAFQHRVFALLRRREMLAVTNSRTLIVRRGIFGGFDMQDHQWKDLENAQVSEYSFPKLFGCAVSFIFIPDVKIRVVGIPSLHAPKIYSFCQQQEQEWKEKRRVREMEEKRAAAGGVVFQGGAGHMLAQASSHLSQSGISSALAEIEKAKTLLDAGVISDVEFQELKAKILNISSRAF